MASKDSETERRLFQLTSEQADALRATLDETYARLSRRITAEILEPLRRHALGAVAQVLNDLKPTFADIAERFQATLPDNWKGSESITEIGKIFDVMQTTGWCLAWAPREEIVRNILAEEEDSERSRVLLSHRDEIVADIRGVLDNVLTSDLVHYRESAGKALSAFQGGHPEAAQAFAATIMTALIQSHMGYRTFGEARRDLEGDPRKHGIGTFRRAAVFNQVAMSLQEYYEHRGHEVPRTFSRHATAHAISSEQFTEINALSSLLLLGGFLRELESESVVRVD